MQRITFSYWVSPSDKLNCLPDQICAQLSKLLSWQLRYHGYTPGRCFFISVVYRPGPKWSVNFKDEWLRVKQCGRSGYASPAILVWIKQLHIASMISLMTCWALMLQDESLEKSTVKYYFLSMIMFEEQTVMDAKPDHFEFGSKSNNKVILDHSHRWLAWWLLWWCWICRQEAV